MKKWKIILPSLMATAFMPVVSLVGCGGNKPVATYDISISDKDKNGYIIDVTEPYFEYNLSFKGLVEGDIITSKIVASSKDKTKIADGYAEHEITKEEAESKNFKLKVVPKNDSPDQFVFSDEMSIKFEFKHDDQKCYEETIEGFVLDAAIATKSEYFTYQDAEKTILSGFDLTNHKADLLKCGVLFVPETVTTIADEAFSTTKHTEYKELFNGYLKWLLLDKSFKGACDLVTIGSSAFEGCNLRETLYIPKTVKTIGSKAFCSCNFSQFVYLGDTESCLSSIGQYAFAGCTSLSGILSIPNAKSFTTLATEVFGKAIGVETSKGVEELIIPKNIKVFNSKCLNGFTNLKVIDLSDYDESDIPTDIKDISDYCFYDFPDKGTIYVKNKVMSDLWTKIFTMEQRHIFDDFKNGNWTIKIKE